MADALGAVTVRLGGKNFRCHLGRKRRSRAFCARQGAAAKKGRRRRKGVKRTKRVRNTAPRRGKLLVNRACRDSQGRAGFANKQGRCVAPKRRRRAKG